MNIYQVEDTKVVLDDDDSTPGTKQPASPDENYEPAETEAEGSKPDVETDAIDSTIEADEEDQDETNMDDDDTNENAATSMGEDSVDESKTKGDSVVVEGVPAGEIFQLGDNWQVCPAEQATKIHKEIVYATIPKMHKLLTEKVSLSDWVIGRSMFLQVFELLTNQNITPKSPKDTWILLIPFYMKPISVNN